MRKFTPDTELLLLDPSANPIDRADALISMRSDRLVKHEPLVASLVEHPNGHLRAEALHTLLQWNREAWVAKAIELAAHDQDDRARGILARELAYSGNNYPKYREDILRCLAGIIENDPNDLVSATAYSSLRYLLLDNDRHPKVAELGFDRRRDVDWSLVEPYRVSPSAK
jgi:hypothetical protein